MDREDPIKKKVVRPDADGKLTKSEADAYYQSGKKGTLNIEASSVDLNFIDPKTLSYDEYTVVQTLYSSTDGRTYGRLNIKLVKGTTNKVVIGDDLYNFEQYPNPTNDLQLGIRNAATAFAKWNLGSGSPFNIHFVGQGTVNGGNVPLNYTTNSLSRYSY